MVTGEISSIYKKNGRVRKVHNLILLPGLEAAETLAHEPRGEADDKCADGGEKCKQQWENLLSFSVHHGASSSGSEDISTRMISL